ncbi:glycosyltransferase [Geotalea toluenoxydans]|uniref:glycosyltransferase n=1 Tax=Geotalea toluenoxydans TaxID=421624 RepID=UPI000B1457C9|nr:glycosyltransferase [Geotalea toluenoxydans]
MNLPYSVYLPQVSPAYRKDTAPLFNNDKLQILNCFVSTTYDGLYHLCFDYRNSSGRIFTSMVTLPYGQELANLKLTDQHGNELNISGESLYAVFANSYDFAASSSEYFGNPAATSVKPAIAFTIRHSSIKGPITVYRYINWLAELGFKVSVYSDDDPPDWVELKATFYKIVHDNGRYGAITEPIVVVYSLLELPQVLRYCHTRGKRIFHLCQGLEEFHVTRPPAGELPQAAPIFQILNSLPVGRIVVSPHLQLYFEDRYRQRCFPIFNGIDLGAFSPGEKPARPAGRYHILITGDPQHPLKGIPVVREAVALLARKHPGRQLVLTSISGQDVPEKSDATGFTSRLQSRLEPEEMCREYRDADVYVNASWYEGFGLPSLEAMACGTPVVQVANHGLEGIIEDGRNCLLVAEQDAATIAEALERLLTDHDLRQRIIAGGMATAAGYALPHQYGMLVAEFQKITGRQPDACLTNKKMKELEAAMDHYPKESAENSGLLFSILVPSYNQANFLPATLDSILAQDYPNWEALVVNDGSTDGTAAVMERYSSLDPRIRTFHQENGGVASALNVGLQHARGQWICWLSSDDLFEPGKLSLHLETIRNHPDVRFMHTNYSLLYDQTGEKVPVERNGEGLNDPARQLAAFLEANQVNGISIAIHRQVFDLVGHFDERLRNGQDFDMWLRIVSHYQPLYLNERTVVTRIHPAQGTSLSVEAGIYDSGRSCLDFLNNHPFPALFPKADLGDTSQSLQAVQFTLHILANPGSLINLCGYGPALLERMYEWLTSAGEQLQAQLEAHLPGIVESFQQDFYPEEIRQAFQRLPSSFGQSFSYKKHDPIQDLERKAECLDREQKIAEASALRKYLAKATGRDTSFATNVPFWQKLQEDGYFENHPLYGKEHNGLKLFGDDDAFVQQFLPLKREMKVVVIGCGYGRESALLARHVKHVYGIDVSRTLLDKTERFMKEQGIDNFTAVLAEEWEKVIPQGIDLVYSIVVFQHLTKDLVRNYVNGLAKKMAPGGRFLCQFCDAAGGSDDAHLAAYEPNVRWSMGEIEELIHNSGLDKVTIDDQEVAEGVRWYWAFFGDTSNASSALDRPVEGEQQESPAAAYAAAVSLADAGKPSEASAVLERLVSLHPEFALAHNGLGVLCCNGGQMDKALFHHEQAARLEPGNATFRKNLADFYQVVLGRTEEALQIYVKLLAVQPKDLEVLTALGKLCITQDKLDDAEYFFTRALEIEPWNMDIRQSWRHCETLKTNRRKLLQGSALKSCTGKLKALPAKGCLLKR